MGRMQASVLCVHMHADLGVVLTREFAMLLIQDVAKKRRPLYKKPKRK